MLFLEFRELMESALERFDETEWRLRLLSLFFDKLRAYLILFNPFFHYLLLFWIFLSYLFSANSFFKSLDVFRWSIIALYIISSLFKTILWTLPHPTFSLEILICNFSGIWDYLIGYFKANYWLVCTGVGGYCITMGVVSWSVSNLMCLCKEYWLL
jgi:hypothetical protein